jgi:hypothetical protein
MLNYRLVVERFEKMYLLTKVIRGPESTYFRGFLGFGALLENNRRTLDDYIKVFARLTLSNYRFAIFECHGFQCIRYRQSFPLFQRL